MAAKGFSGRDAQRIARTTQIVERRYQYQANPNKGYRPGWVGTKWAVVTQAFAASDGTMFQYGKVKLRTKNGDTAQDDDIVDAHSLWSAPVPVGTRVQVTIIDGEWALTTQDCSN